MGTSGETLGDGSMNQQTAQYLAARAAQGRVNPSHDPSSRGIQIFQDLHVLDDTDVMGFVDELELMAAPQGYYQNSRGHPPPTHPTHLQMLRQAEEIQAARQTAASMVGMAGPRPDLLSYGGRATSFLMPEQQRHAYAAQAPYNVSARAPDADTNQAPSSSAPPSAGSGDSAVKRKRIRYTDTFKKAKRCEGEKKRIKKISETIEKIKVELETNANAPRDLPRQDVLDMALCRLAELHRQNVKLTQLVQVQVMQQHQQQEHNKPAPNKA